MACTIPSSELTGSVRANCPSGVIRSGSESMRDDEKGDVTR